MSKFKKFRRIQISEMRKVTKGEVRKTRIDTGEDSLVSISHSDLRNGSPKIGDVIARNPKDHADQWLVSEQYFKDNFEMF